MKSTANKDQAGIVLITILVMLTLFGIVGITFVFYAAPADCSQNPTVEIRDGRCTQTIGPDRR